MDNPDRSDPSAERLTKLEELFTHLQQTVLDLNQAVIECHRRIEAVDAKVSRAVETLAERAADPERPFDPEAERPPHY